MIKTERQLAKSKDQLALLERGLANAAPPSPGVHPIIAEAGQRALLAQARDLREEIDDYEALRDGRVPAPDLSAVGSLHLDLIRARIAAGLTQAELARRLGVDPQQIQRYEASDYRGASLARLQEIAATLGGPVRSAEVAVADEPSLLKRLTGLGLPRPVALRLVLGAARPRPFGQVAATAAKGLGVTVEQLLAPEPPVLAAAVPGFKLPINAASTTVAAYASYARAIASVVAASTRTGEAMLPSSPDDIQADLAGPLGIGFRELVEYAWNHGVAVVPLRDGGTFHAAFWDVDGTGVVVLKQGTRTADRWAFDLAHELCHAADHVSGRRPLPDGLIDDETVSGWAKDPQEQRANRFAGRALLGTHADDLASEAAKRAGGRADRLKRAVSDVARERGVAVGALANYIAFRVGQEGLNWWGAATNLQESGEDPWAIARDALLARVDFGALDDESRELLTQALAD